MKAKSINLIWGFALIVAGGLFLAQNLGLIPNMSSQIWVGFFTGLSLVFFACYFLGGMGQWGWLFPALISGALALTIGLGAAGVSGSFVGAPILASVAIPFIVVYARDRQRNGWALIPAWVLSVITVITILADVVPGEVMGSLVMFSIGLPFLVVYWMDRSRWWALIPAGVMLVVGVIPILTLRFSGDLFGSLIMFLFALPFVVVYVISPRNWWALIPAGAMATIGVVVLVATNSRPGFSSTGLVSGVLFFGFALTFFLLWLLRSNQPTDWAKYPAGILAVIGVLAMALGAFTLEYIWPLVIIIVGTVLLYSALRHRAA